MEEKTSETVNVRFGTNPRTEQSPNLASGFELDSSTRMNLSIQQMRAKMTVAQLAPVDKELFLEIVYLRFHTWVTRNNIDVSEFCQLPSHRSSSETPDADLESRREWEWSSDRASTPFQSSSELPVEGGKEDDDESFRQCLDVSVIAGAGVENVDADGGAENDGGSIYWTPPCTAPSPDSSVYCSVGSSADCCLNNGRIDSSCDQSTLSDLDADDVPPFDFSPEETPTCVNERRVQNKLRNVVRKFLLQSFVIPSQSKKKAVSEVEPLWLLTI